MTEFEKYISGGNGIKTNKLVPVATTSKLAAKPKVYATPTTKTTTLLSKGSTKKVASSVPVKRTEQVSKVVLPSGLAGSVLPLSVPKQEVVVRQVPVQPAKVENKVDKVTSASTKKTVVKDVVPAPLEQAVVKSVVTRSPLETALAKQDANNASMNGGDYVEMTNAEKAALAQSKLGKSGVDYGFGSAINTPVQQVPVESVVAPTKVDNGLAAVEAEKARLAAYYGNDSNRVADGITQFDWLVAKQRANQ